MLHSTSKTLGTTDETEFYDFDEMPEPVDTAVDDVKQSVLKAALPHAHQHGWSRLALAKGAESIGLSSAAHGLFSRGEVELVEFFNQSCNQELVTNLKKMEHQKERSEEQMSFIRSALEQRLRMILPYRDIWPTAMTLMAHPPNALYSLKNLHELVDDILYYAGYRSADFSWYPKRAGLAAVYIASELALMNDKSPDCIESWVFLDRRLEDYNKGGNCYKKAEEVLENTPEFIGGSISTIRNMLGFGSTIR